MLRSRRFFNVLISFILAFVLIYSLITYGSCEIDMEVFAQGTVAFTPSIPTLQVTQTLVATPVPTIDLSGYLSIGSSKYPIGDIFHDASGLRLSAERSDVYGRFGLATLHDDPEYRLIWYRESVTVTHYLIIKSDDVLYEGENGFLQHFEAFLSNLDKMHASGAAGVAGAATVVGLGLAGCAPSVGAGCIVGAVGGVLSLIGGLIGETYYYHKGVKPEMEALISLFDTIDTNR
jgi:hypothetical protein